MRLVKVKIYHGPYVYRCTIPAGDDEDNGTIKARAKAKMHRECGQTIGMCAETIKIEGIIWVH